MRYGSGLLRFLGFFRAREIGREARGNTLPLVNRAGSGAGRPILRREFDSPEVRAGREKFDSDAGTFFGCVAEVDDAAILFFFRAGINQHQLRAHFEFGLQVKETAMSIDDDGLAGFLKFLSQQVSAGGAHRNAGEDARTASLAALGFCL
jgi:hypothetical protein